MWEGVGDRTELQHIDPHSIGHNRVSFPFSWAAQLGAWRPTLQGAGFLYRILSPAGLISKLTDFLSLPSYTIVQSPTQYLPITGHRDVSLPLSLEWHVWLSCSSQVTLFWCISLTAPRDFTMSHFVSQARPRQWNMHFRRLWNGMFGRVEGQYTAQVPSKIGSNLQVGALIRCVLLHFVCYLKAAQMNVRRGLHMLYEFKLGHNDTEVIKNILVRKS